MIKGLFWCFAVLFAQLGLLRYVDLRVAAMPRLEDAPAGEPGTEAVAPATPPQRFDA